MQFKKILVLSVAALALTACSGDNPGDHVHTFEQGWTSDATNHWHKATCEHRDVKDALAAHTFGDDGKCSVCNYQKPVDPKMKEEEFKALLSKIQEGGCDITFTQEAHSGSTVLLEEQTYQLKLNVPELAFEEYSFKPNSEIEDGTILKDLQEYSYDGSQWLPRTKYSKEKANEIVANQVNGLMSYFFPVTDFEELEYNKTDGSYSLSGTYYSELEKQEFLLNYKYVMNKDSITSITGSMSAPVPGLGEVVQTISSKSFTVGAAKVEAPSAHFHDFNTLVDVQIEATCEHEGLGIYQCSCGETTSLVIPKTEHKEVSYPEVPATCADGYTGGSYCSECLEELEPRQVLPGTGEHNVVDGQDVPATCSKPGLTNVKVCSVCGEIISSTEVPKLPHNFRYETIVPAAYKEEGLRHATCNVCGYEEDQVIPAIEYDISKLWDGTHSDCFAGGDGTEGNPYLISNASELAFLAYIYSDGVIVQSYYNCYFKLTDDIVINDCAEYETWTGSESNLNRWKPIGTDYPFKGYFDGDNHTIYGIFMKEEVPKNSGRQSHCGLFGSIQSGEIANVNIKNSFYISINGGVGAIVDEYRTYSKIEIKNCKVDAIIKGDTSVGGILGHCGSSSGWVISVSGCETRGTYACTKLHDKDNDNGGGGIVGKYWHDQGGISIDKCVNYADIEAMYAGGIVGYHYQQYSQNTATMRVTNCENYGTIKSSMMSGGIVAYGFLGVYSYDGIKLYNNNNYGDVSSTGGEAGGIAGALTDRTVYNSKNIIEACMNAGNVSAVDNSDYYTSVGGIIGRINGPSDASANSTITIASCFNTGKVSGYNYVGGIVGNTGRVLIKACENAGEVSGMNSVGGIVGQLFWAIIQSTFSIGTVKAETIPSITVYKAEKCGAVIGSEGNGATSWGKNIYLKGISTLDGTATGPVGSEDFNRDEHIIEKIEANFNNYSLSNIFGDDNSLYKKPNESINFKYPLVKAISDSVYMKLFPVEAQD